MSLLARSPSGWPVRSTAVTCLLMAFMSVSARAHDGPEHVIEELTALMRLHGETADLLYRRAIEHRSLGSLDAAAADLEAAVRADANHFAAWCELASVRLHQHQPDKTLKALDAAEPLATSDADRARVLVCRGEVLATRKQFRAAADLLDRAVRLSPDVPVYLRRAELQTESGDHAARCAGLREGLERTGSGLIEAAWIDAMLDARRGDEVGDRIEKKLATVRVRSSWLLRRARLRLQADDRGGAESDLRAALAEINERLDPMFPDGSLLLDRGLVCLLLDRRGEALADLNAAKKLKLPSTMYRRLERLLEPEAAATQPKPPEDRVDSDQESGSPGRSRKPGGWAR